MLETPSDCSNFGGEFPHPSSSHLNSCGGDSSEEELAVLPRNTKVVVTGNNRTKSVLVGVRGVVKKAVGLGGWHWLVLTNGIEVKLQRNALTVIEAPSGNEEDRDLDYEEAQCDGSNLAFEHGERLPKQKIRLQKPLETCRKTHRRPLSGDLPSKDHLKASMKVDLGKLEMDALWKYLLHFNLADAVPNPSREQLIDVVQRHFISQQVDELQVISGFVQAAKRLKNLPNK